MVRRRVASSAYLSAFTALVMLLSGSLAGCSDNGVLLEGISKFRLARTLSGSSEVDVIWKSHDGQFVRLETQDEVKEGAKTPNAQPVHISPEWIGGALTLILVRRSPGDRAEPLFTEENINILGQYLSEGLVGATPRQDVTFAVLSGGRPDVTSGRVFFVGNQLNIIFGSILGDGSFHDGNPEYRSKADNPVDKPFTPGRRDFSANNKVILTTPPWSGIYRVRGVNRNDWLVITPQANVARMPAPAQVKSWPPAAGYYQQPPYGTYQQPGTGYYQQPAYPPMP